LSGAVGCYYIKGKNQLVFVVPRCSEWVWGKV